MVHSALQVVHNFVSKLYKWSSAIPADNAKSTQNILALWECIGEARERARNGEATERFWLGVCVSVQMENMFSLETLLKMGCCFDPESDLMNPYKPACTACVSGQSGR